MPPATLSCRECALQPQDLTQVMWSICDPNTGFCSTHCMTKHSTQCIQCILSLLPRPSPAHILTLLIPVAHYWMFHWMPSPRVVPTRCTPNCDECIVCETCHRCGPYHIVSPGYILEDRRISNVPPPPTRSTVDSWQVGMTKFYALRDTETHIHPVNRATWLFVGRKLDGAWTGPLLVTGCSAINCMGRSHIRDITLGDIDVVRNHLATTTKPVSPSRRELGLSRDKVLSGILDNMLKRGRS
jgi:hypothetical protein